MAELYGSPWTTSVVQGNLPAEAPAVKGDLYTHYNYDYLAAHQEQPSGMMEDHSQDLKTTNLAVIGDASKTNHDLDQLRIFYEQAADLETVKERGLSDLQPYLDHIDAVASIEDMNALLSADDFPFSPFVLTYFTLADTRDANIVNVAPNLALVEDGALYKDAGDPQEQETLDTAIRNAAQSARECERADVRPDLRRVRRGGRRRDVPRSREAHQHLGLERLIKEKAGGRRE